VLPQVNSSPFPLAAAVAYREEVVAPAWRTGQVLDLEAAAALLLAESATARPFP